jgi:hypothetical protein
MTLKQKTFFSFLSGNIKSKIEHNSSKTLRRCTMAECHFSQFKIKQHKVCFKCDFKLCIIIINKYNGYTSLCFYITTNFKGMLPKHFSTPFQMQGTNFIVVEGYIFSSVSLTFFTLYSFLSGGNNVEFYFVKIIWKNTYRRSLCPKSYLKT